jgi:hypothetical protein
VPSFPSRGKIRALTLLSSYAGGTIRSAAIEHSASAIWRNIGPAQCYLGHMQALLRKLASLDSDAERGVRLIEFFDQLVVHRADLEAVVRATAVLAHATVGAVDDRLSAVCLIDRHGVQLPPVGPSVTAVVQDVLVDGVSAGRVWLERGRETAEWDDLIVARMALTVATVRDPRRNTMPNSPLGLSDPAVLQILLRPEADEAELSRAVCLLGFVPGQVVNVIALAADDNIDRALAHFRSELMTSTGRRVVGAVLTERLAVLVAAAGTIDEIPLPEGVAACIGDIVPVESCAAAWQGARKGVRFARLGHGWRRWQRLDQLGALVLLADLPASAVQALPDVRAIGAVAARRGGDVDIRLIETVCLSTSVREAATALHLHHSSAGYRLNALQNALGFDVRSGDGRYRARTALLLWQLNAPQLAPTEDRARTTA